MSEHKKKAPFDLPTLPVKINYDDLVEYVTRAHSALSRLDELLTHMGNPSHLERTFFTREAVLSSKIEGTQVTLDDVLKKDAEEVSKKVDGESSERERDFVEVFNYRRAMRAGIKMIDNGETLSENNVKKLHIILLDSERGKSKSPGEFRRDQVYIAPPGTPMEDARYIPPVPRDISNLYSNFDRYLNTSSERDLLVQIAIAHYQFEALHPFKDGNGRIGRLLIPLFLYKQKIIARPLIYISKYFEEHRADYYDLLAGVSYKDAWTPWIRFFLEGLCQQAQDATQLGRSIVKLREEYQDRMTSLHSAYAFNLLDAIFQRPYFTPKLIKEESGILNAQTLLTLIAKFVEAGIIADLDSRRKRNKVYGFTALISILEESRKRQS